MTQRSMWWTNGKAHGGPYSQDDLRLLPKALFGAPSADEGVLANQLNELAVTTTGNNNVTVNTGRALVDGTLYENDASVPITTTSPAVGTTGRRLVLRKDWTDGDVTATVISSADGTATLPALTQVDGATWDIPLASFTITTGGVIGSLTDERSIFWGVIDAMLWGDGSDGDVTIAAGHTDLTRDMYYRTLTVDAGATLDTDGYRIFARDWIVVNGTITNVAGEGGTTNSHIGAPAGTLGGGGNGVLPPSGNNRAGAGGGVVLLASPSITGSGTISAPGAAGYYAGNVTGLGGTLTAAGTLTPPAESVGGTRVVRQALQAVKGQQLAGIALSGGSGGGCGTNGAATAATAVTNAMGGAGGAVAGVSLISGGGGGFVLTISLNPPASTLTLSAAGGAAPASQVGNPGAAGTVVSLTIS